MLNELFFWVFIDYDWESPLFGDLLKYFAEHAIFLDVRDADSFATEGALFFADNDLFDAYQTAVVLTAAEHHGDSLCKVIFVGAKFALNLSFEIGGNETGLLGFLLGKEIHIELVSS